MNERSNRPKTVWLSVLSASILASYLLFIFGNDLLKLFIEFKIGQHYQTNISLEQVNLRPFAGIITFKKVVLRAPTNMRHIDEVAIEKIKIHFKPASIFSDTIQIKQILIQQPKIHTKLSNQDGSNLSTITTREDGEHTPSSWRKYTIEQFECTQLTVQIIHPDGTHDTLTIPGFEAQRIGFKERGLSVPSLLDEILPHMVEHGLNAMTTYQFNILERSLISFPPQPAYSVY